MSASPEELTKVELIRKRVGAPEIPNGDQTKRMRLESSDDSEIDNLFVPSDDDDGNFKDISTEVEHYKKSKLSKWASRLFDPNRPRGVIQPPEILPQNDVYLEAFGMREKALHGKDDQSEKDDESDSDGDVEKKMIPQKKESKKSAPHPLEGSKVKISNLKYTTTEETLTRLLSAYGDVVECNLIMDRVDEAKALSIGKAFAVFSTPAEAEACVEALQEKMLDGRPIRLEVISNDRKDRNYVGNASNRYWDFETDQDALAEQEQLRMLSFKCRRCNEGGHMEASCSQSERQNPCILCAKKGHIFRECPVSVVCFNCGVPGHLAQACNYPRGRPKRLVCGMCFASGHHRWQCPVEHPNQIHIRDSLCMDCHQAGHFSCKRATWEYNVTLRSGCTGGFSCFNCGEFGHHGASCTRPKVDVCARDLNMVLRELARAGKWVDYTEKSFQTTNDSQVVNSVATPFRGRRGYQDTPHQRSRTQPPPESRHYRADNVDVQFRPY